MSDQLLHPVSREASKTSLAFLRTEWGVSREPSGCVSISVSAVTLRLLGSSRFKGESRV